MRLSGSQSFGWAREWFVWRRTLELGCQHSSSSSRALEQDLRAAPRAEGEQSQEQRKRWILWAVLQEPVVYILIKLKIRLKLKIKLNLKVGLC